MLKSPEIPIVLLILSLEISEVSSSLPCVASLFSLLSSFKIETGLRLINL
jgi:hypothetical protein